MTTNTISRAATRKIAEIQAKNLTCRLHQVGKDYPVDVDPQYAWEALAKYHSARLTVDHRGGWTVQVHGNLWYRLTETG